MQLMKEIINLIKKEKLPLLVKTIVVFALVAGFLVLIAEQSSNSSGIKTFFDAVWWAFVTITTVGYGDISPVTPTGKILGVFVMFGGIGLTSVFTATISSIMIERRINVNKGLETVSCKNHLIISGWNSNGLSLLETLRKDTAFDNNTEIVLNGVFAETELAEIRDRFRDLSFYYVKGDISKEVILKRTNVVACKLVVILSDNKESIKVSDDHTILKTLAIKSLNHKVKVIAELNNSENVDHLKRAHVDEIILNGEFNPFLLSSATCDQGMSDILRELMDHSDEGASFTKVKIPRGLYGKTFLDVALHFRKEHQAIAIGIITEAKNIGLQEILNSESSAIDAFIKMAFERSKKKIPDATHKQKSTVLNPSDDTVIGDNDFAILIANQII
ncbi:MAG: NAD-binding protein [Candidatus Cloacimonetes bacterium]|nr:NAD-binding protein [Candidatus Cloacimonadota bacterium]